VKKLVKILRYWSPPLIWALVIFLFSSYPTRRASEIFWQDFIVKKTAHVVEYAIFSTLLYRAFKESGAKKTNAGIFAITLSILYAVSDEFHQSFTPGREPTARDVIFDTIGASLAIYTIWNLLPKAPKRLKKWAESLQLL
jgi:glycopeptide antibiotics resistance protein